MQSISTTRTIASHLNSLNTKKARYMVLAIQILAWDIYNNIACVNLLVRSQPSPLMIGAPTMIQIFTQTSTHSCLHRKTTPYQNYK